MTQNNMRKEPSFGTPSMETETTPIDPSEKLTQEVKSYVSLHSTKSPGHTFTPIMKRPETVVSETEQTAMNAESSSAKEFAFTPVTDAETTVEKEENLTLNSESEKLETEQLVIKTENFTTERVIPSTTAGVAAAAIAAENLKSQETTRAQMPAKARRLLLVGLLVLALLALFFFLKPSTPETVEELQSQGGSLPIEFRPVDEAEAKRAEEQARAEQEAAKQQQEALVAEQIQNSPQQIVEQPTVQTVAPTVTKFTEAKEVEIKPIESKSAMVQTTAKPKTQGSVVYQPETAQKEQPKAPMKTERLTSQVQKEAVKVLKPTVEKTGVKADVSTTKTMTVPKGVSLMQVFRDNHLNIADVNAMSKVNNIVSNLKVGERVTVRLDNNNRVVEMSIGSGGKFIRQPNGSYAFK